MLLQLLGGAKVIRYAQNSARRVSFEKNCRSASGSVHPLERSECPQPPEADIRLPERDSRFDPERSFYHPCFATRLGGVSGGKETQGWRDSSHTAMVGAGKFGSAKLPMATATYPGKPSLSQ